MMRSIVQRHRNVHIGSMMYFTKGRADGGRSPIENSEDDQDLQGSFHKQVMSTLSYLGSITIQSHHTHNSTSVWHSSPDSHAHAICLWQHRDLCTMASQEPANLKQEVGCEDARKAAWEALASQMQALRGRVATGKSLEALKGLVDQLKPFAEPTDLRLGVACLRVAESLVVARQCPTTYLGYAQRALPSIETLSQSLEHVYCLFILGLAYYKMQEFRKALVQLEHCLLVLRQAKVTMDERNVIAHKAHHLRGKAEYHLEDFSKSIVQYEHAIRIGQKILKAQNRPLPSRSMPILHYEAGLVCRELAHSDVGGMGLAAMDHAQKALDGFMRRYGPSSLQVGKARALMSGLHCDHQEYEDALYNYYEAKPILEYLEQTEEFAKMNWDMANLLIYQKKYDAVLPFLEQVMKSTEVASGLHFAALLGAALVASTLNLEAAADYCTKAVDALDHQETSEDTAINMARLAMLCVGRDEFMQAAVLFHKAVEMADKFSVCIPHSVYAEDMAVQQELERKIGSMPFQARKIKEAISFFDSLLKIIDGKNRQESFMAHFRLGTAYLKGNQEAEAIVHFEACNRMVDAWVLMKLVDVYKFAIKNGNTDNMGALENVGLCILWLLK